MRRIIDNDYVTMFSRLLVGVVFIVASLYKIADSGAFAKSIWYYHLVPGHYINLIAIVLPWLEIFCGVALILGIFYRGSVLWTNVLTIVFIAALASTIARNLSIDCGCFKAGSTATGPAWRSLWFDVVLLAFTLQLAFSRSRRWLLMARR